MIRAAKKLGVIGGLSRFSTIRCHEAINREIQGLTGHRTAANLVIWSLDPETMVHLLSRGDWRSVADQIEEAAANLLFEGVDGLMFTNDLVHCVLERRAISFPVPVIHVRDALAEEIRRQSFKKIGFIGPTPTMSEPYYQGLIQRSDGVDVVLPSQNLWINIDYTISNRIYNAEPTVFEVETYTRILSEFESQNVDAIVVATSEISLAFNKPSPVPVLHTAKIHAAAAARWCVADDASLRPEMSVFDDFRLAPAKAIDQASGDGARIMVGMPHRRDDSHNNRTGKTGAPSAGRHQVAAGRQTVRSQRRVASRAS